MKERGLPVETRKRIWMICKLLSALWVKLNPFSQLIRIF
jgi:hypothetical protein